MKLAIGSDAGAWALKEKIKDYLVGLGHEVKDFGVADAKGDTPYYQTAHVVAESVISKEVDQAVLICGTGMGMAIIANKHPGIYAAVCETPFAAEKARSVCNANVLTIGAMISTETMSKEIVDAWLNTEFTQGWDASIQEWLRNSMDDISALEEAQFAKK